MGRGAGEVDSGSKKKRWISSYKDYCDVIVHGSSAVNNWKWPNIEGPHDYKGILPHSVAWDMSLNWSGKSVGVIGTGSSSIQRVPKFAETAKDVTVFMRHHTSIASQIEQNISNGEADPDAIEPMAAGKHHCYPIP
ncbi:hypothetical protein Z517_03562 [Fonsecaea pedrosoi CBS 271.37]|uniref:Uncharacterized protein n=1 Tax=Fonsecaea pedrosoi CBS 271.37 TaxID=1442368 RepID=A0A0D2FCF6_9EURO|nr:uncharacterized protein Z517_03562 [Fonsecaea pedrosoi CBS 271.37]KIW84312.1 hypothetical protein Z517_03562 [Fonsecaea pedrosoi CBS 271.37]